MNKSSRIYIAGHTGLVGSAILEKLRMRGYKNLLYASHKKLDLTKEELVSKFFEEKRPNYVFLCAARVGGIHANNIHPVQFFLENVKIQNNIIEYSQKYGVNKLIFLGSSCIYPKYASCPINENEFLNGKLEPTNDAYAIAKISGIMLCKSMNKQYGTNFMAVMPTNLYGERDNFDLNTSHVLPAMLNKFHKAKIENKDVELWGTGKPLREFLHVKDLADALIFIMNKVTINESIPIINIGYGKDISIKCLAHLITRIVGFNGKIVWNTKYPDGTYRKLLDTSKLFNLGWEPKILLEEGIKQTYEWFCNNV